MFGISVGEVFALMVFCKACKKRVEDCVHFVYPIEAPRVSVFDAKIETLAYSRAHQILEITFKTGQVWQLFEVPANIYHELRDTTISSFLRFIAHKYPIRTCQNRPPCDSRS
jgi:KTSC domain-containing protein